ncbi:hydroxymethylglutaryl-CoA lyase [Pigmentiphaga kullae]|uniref:Hydroxymethylglutaryl-CoA lyase/(R)-citramalyl-CoA lyase n=1 Tax=Pigmentiphaga kullae TaxID=151784 RepID=A0A4V2F2D2_9BURK|nr:hydroxymethylglutaryl-CoA lyase [Pigmentiphaga kullae]RZS77122.1 hydroxymethylglutaryl-CoA lyase/(R)-citramalyl-CoA lyase [Pigmentiphaga kullae]
MDGHVQIIDVAPRDGIQNERVLLPAADKIELIRRIADAGGRRIEATSFVNPKRVPQMADAEAVMAGIERRPGLSLIGLVLNEPGLARARAAGCDEANVVVVASETFSRKNQGAGVADVVAAASAILDGARAAGMRTSVTVGAAFGCPFEGEVPAQRVLALVEALLPARPDEIALADTIGCGVPTQVRELLAGTRALAPRARLRCHFHNTRNTGIANVLAALEAGVDALDASTGGFGGCPFAPAATGNIATEDVVYMLERMGVATGIDLDAVLRTAQWLSERLQRPAIGGVSRAGRFPSAAAQACA